MTGQAIITRLSQLQDIPEADKIQQARIYGETVIVSKDHKEGELGILFDMETQLSHEFCHHNNLYRHSHLNSDPSKEGYFDDNRRVRPIRLKGVQCSGFWMPIESLSYIDRCFGYDSSKENGASSLEEGMQLTEIDGNPICNKWVPSRARTPGSGKRKKEGRVSLADLVPSFKEHVDTDHWARNQHVLQEKDLVIITEKLHGTSGRCSYTRVQENLGLIRRCLSYIFLILMGNKKPFWSISAGEYKFVVGSRRAVKSIDGMEKSNSKHYYDSDLWTKVSKENFEGKLHKGETVYFEIVGYTPESRPIMGTYSNEKLKNFMDKKEYKKFIERYGKETVFSYGCSQFDQKTAKELRDAGVEFDKDIPNDYNLRYESSKNLNKLFVYRITQTNEDGISIDLSWEQVKQRCEKLEVSHVPQLSKFIATQYRKHSSENPDKLITYMANHHGEDINQMVEHLTHVSSENFPQHLREGVVVRIEHGGFTPTFLKHKNYYYRVLEGQIKEPTIEDEN